MDRRPDVGPLTAAALALGAAFLLILVPAARAAEPDKATDKAAEDYNMAAWLYGQGKYDLSAEEFQAFLAKYPQHEKVPDARLGLARALVHLGKNDEAVLALEELRRTAPQFEGMPEALFHLGQALAAAGKAKEAGDAFDEILKSHGDHYLASWARARRGEMLLVLKQPDEAEKVLAPLVEEFLTGKDAPKRLQEERKRLGEAAPAAATTFDALLERAHLNLGLARLGAGRFGEARESFEEFLALAPKSGLATTARFHLAQSLYQESQFARAAEVYAEVAGTDSPFAGDAAFERALALYQAKNYKDAAGAFADAAKRLGDSERGAKARLYAGMCLYLAGNAREAVACLQEHLNANADDAEARYWLAAAYLKENKPVEAREAFDELLRRSPDGPRAADARVGRADALLAEGKPEEAAQAYRDFAGKHPEHAEVGRALYAAAAAFHRAGRFDESDAACNEFLQKAAGGDLEAQVLFVSGENRFRVKRYADAAERFRTLLEKHGDAAQAPAGRLRLAWIRYFEKNIDAAIEELARLDAKADPAIVAEAAYLRGVCLYEKESYKPAAEAFARYLEKEGEKPLAASALVKQALALRRAGDPQAAERLKQFLEQYGSSTDWPQAAYELAELERGEKRFDEAVGHYRAVADRFADHALAPYALYNLGVCEFEKGAFGEAAEAFGLAAEKYPQADLAPQAMYQKALALQKADRVADARAAYQAMVEKHGGHDLVPSALLGLGVCLEKEEKFAEAAEAFRRLLGASKDAAVREQAAYELAWSLQKAGKEKEAADAYEQLVRDFPKSRFAADAHFQMAEARYRDKKYADASRLYEKALDAAGDRLKDKVLYRLGWCRWAEEKFDQSAALFDRLVAEAPGSDLAAEALLQAGEAYARLGKMPEAIERLVKLADPKYKDFPRLADARFRLGEAQLALGRAEDALATFTALEQASPDYPAMAEVQFDLGKALYDLRRLDQARERFERAVAGTDTETGAKAQFYVGETLLAAGDARQALRAYLRVVSPLWSAYKDWAAAAQFEIGKCYLSLNQPAEARGAFQTVLEKYGDTKWAQPAREQLAKMPG